MTRMNVPGFEKGEGFLRPTQEAHGADDQIWEVKLGLVVKHFYDRCVKRDGALLAKQQTGNWTKQHGNQ